MPAYREFYTKSGDETYGFMCDGDVHVFHYRPSLFKMKISRTPMSSDSTPR